MKRIIDGVTYNTDTATLVAQQTCEGSSSRFDRGGKNFRIVDTPYEQTVSLYRTRGGNFFFVDLTVHFVGEDGAEKRAAEFQPVPYDEAYAYIKSGVTPLVPNIFPTIPEAVDA